MNFFMNLDACPMIDHSNCDKVDNNQNGILDRFQSIFKIRVLVFFHLHGGGPFQMRFLVL
jgi:hypothetical protein